MGQNPSPYTLLGTNCYLLGSPSQLTLIDTGEGRPEFLSTLTNLLIENGWSLGSIILTHFHHDHIGGVEQILNSLESEGSNKIVLFKRFPKYFGGCDESKFPRWASRLQEIQPDQRWKIDETTELKAICTPGHTSDSISLLLESTNSVSESKRIIFSGDTVLGSGSTSVFNNLIDYLKSLETLKSLNSDLIYPGHGEIIENSNELLSHYINHRALRESQILQFLSKNSPLSPIQLVKKMYENLNQNLEFAAAGNVVLHLQKLKSEGKIRKIEKNQEKIEEIIEDQDESQMIKQIQSQIHFEWEIRNVEK